MKNVFLVLMMLLIPWQASAAADHNFMHVMGEQKSEALFIKHFAEHIALIMHHHDGDDGSDMSYDDDSEKSARHFADCDHGANVNVLFPSSQTVAALPIVRIAPATCLYSFDDRNIAPPRRPPRASV